MVNRMILNETSYFGAGAIAEIPEEINKRHFQKVALITDKGIVEAGITNKIENLLKENDIDYALYDEVVPNPTVENVQKGVAFVENEKADVIVAVGGGSPIDTAKAIGIICTNPEFSDVVSLEGVADTKNPCLPIIAVPTTSGTAAEVTINYVITDEENKRKLVCVDPHDIPIVSIVDSDLMMGMPKKLAASTGMDALTHAIEGYITPGAWEMTDMLHLKAIEIIGRSLRDAVAGDPTAREEMSLAQYIAGMGFSNVGLGLAHGMAHPLSAWYGVPHGEACSILLPLIMKYNKDYTGEKYREIARVLNIEDWDTMSIDQIRNATCDVVEQLGKDVGIPTNVNVYGAKKEDIPEIAKDALADACTPGNPREATLDDIEEIYNEII